MLTAAGLKSSLKETLWVKCFSTATKLDVNTSKDGSIASFESFYSTKLQPHYKNYLHPFGEKAYIAKHVSIQSKLANCGITFIFVGYADNHARNVFCHLLNKSNFHEILFSLAQCGIQQQAKIMTILLS